MRIKQIFFALVLASLHLGSLGCSSQQTQLYPPTDGEPKPGGQASKLPPTPQENYQLGMKWKEQKKNDKAAEHFKQVILLDPSSHWSTKAEIALADIAFAEKTYEDAAIQYEHFQEQHPADSHVTSGYCDYMIAKTNFKMLPTNKGPLPPIHQRDVREFEATKSILDKYLEQYPEPNPNNATNKEEAQKSLAAYREEVKKMHTSVCKVLIRHHLYLARVYLRQHKTFAALERIKSARGLLPKGITDLNVYLVRKDQAIE